MPFRLLIAAIGLACVLLAGEALAQGASPWSEPAELPENTNGPVALVFGADGRGMLVFDGDSPGLAVTDGGGAFSVESRFRTNEAVVPAAFGRHGVLLARQRGGEIFGSPVKLGVSIGDSSGRVGPFRRVARYHPVLSAFGSAVDVATSADGTAVLAWIEALPRSRARVRIAERRGRRGFAAPRTIAAFRLSVRQRLPQAQVALGRGRAFVVAWAERTREVVRARTGRVGGRLGRIQTIGRHGLGPDAARQLDVVLAASGGHAALAWYGADRPARAADTRGIVRVARASSPSWRFGAPTRLGVARRRTDNKGRIGLVLTHGGGVTVAWSDRADDSSSVTLVRAALGTATGDFTEPIDLGTGTVSSAAARSDGTTMITWSGGPPGTTVAQPPHVMAALHAPGAAGFEPAETVSGDEERIFRTVSGFSERTGQPTIAWEARLPDFDPGATNMSFATRAAP